MIDKRLERKDYIYHNILAEDGNVLISGEMEIKGNLISFDNNSGHYKPKIVCFNYLKDLLINEYGFKYVTTNKKNLTHFMKITMVFDNLWEGRIRVINRKSNKSIKSKRSRRSKRSKRSKRNKRSKRSKSSRSKRINKK